MLSPFLWRAGLGVAGLAAVSLKFRNEMPKLNSDVTSRPPFLYCVIMNSL